MIEFNKMTNEEQGECGDSHTVYVFDGERTFTSENFYMVKEIK